MKEAYLSSTGERLWRERTEDGKRRIGILTNSSLTTFRRCPREYQFKYIMLRRSLKKYPALIFGSLFHVGLNAWWKADGADPTERALVAADALREHASKHDVDAFELVKAECLIAGYSARWGDEGYETLGVEKNFRIHAGAYDLGGSIDAIVRRDCIVRNVEHKTTNQDISGGSDYWRHVVTMDPQVSTYMHAARELGYEPRDTIYDAVRKPEIQPLKATPEESRKYTKPTKAEPIPRLYANQREHDETVDEYRTRLTEDIIARPDWYYARKTIVRLEHDDEEHANDVVQTAAMIRFATESNAWPRTPTACERYHRLCEFHDVCSGIASIDDGTRYESKTRQHEELEEST